MKRRAFMVILGCLLVVVGSTWFGVRLISARQETQAKREAMEQVQRGCREQKDKVSQMCCLETICLPEFFL